jgi:hypothetical protein
MPDGEAPGEQGSIAHRVESVTLDGKMLPDRAEARQEDWRSRVY